jgi:hypothetical protein
MERKVGIIVGVVTVIPIVCIISYNLLSEEYQSKMWAFIKQPLGGESTGGLIQDDKS